MQPIPPFRGIGALEAAIGPSEWRLLLNKFLPRRGRILIEADKRLLEQIESLGLDIVAATAWVGTLTRANQFREAAAAIQAMAPLVIELQAVIDGDGQQDPITAANNGPSQLHLIRD